MKKLKIGVVGTGSMGSAHCDSCQKLDEVELTAVCDVDEAVVEGVAHHYKVKSFTDYKQLIDSGDVEAVIVTTPHYFHPPIGIYALKKGLHLLSEKPIGVTVNDADEMIAVSRQTEQVFGAMFQYRTFPHFMAAKKLIDEGKIGEIYRTLMLCGWFRTQAYYDSAGWRASWKEEGGGVLINQAPHMLDMFCYLAGTPNKVRAEVRTRRHKIEVEDEVHALLEYANGGLGYLYISVNEAPIEDRIEIVGEKGKLIIDGSKMQFASLKQPAQEFCNTSPETRAGGAPEVAWEDVDIPQAESGHQEIIRNFARAVLYGEKLLAPGVEGINSLELSNALLFSGMEKKEITLPVGRKEYIKFFDKLVAGSKEKNSKGNKKRNSNKIEVPVSFI